MRTITIICLSSILFSGTAQNRNPLFQKWKLIEYYSWNQNDILDSTTFKRVDGLDEVAFQKRFFKFKESIYDIKTALTYQSYYISKKNKKPSMVMGKVDLDKLLLYDELDGEQIILFCDEKMLIVGFGNTVIEVFIPYNCSTENYDLSDNYILKYALKLIGKQ